MNSDIGQCRSLVLRAYFDRRHRASLDEDAWLADTYLELRHDERLGGVLAGPLRAVVHLAAAIYRAHPVTNYYEIMSIIDDCVYQEDDSVIFDERRIAT